MTSHRFRRLSVFQLRAGTGIGWLQLFLVRIADRLRSTFAGESLLVEQWWDGLRGEVSLLPFSPALEVALKALRQDLPLRWNRLFTTRACEPPAGLMESWFWLAIRARPGSSARPLALPVSSTPWSQPDPGETRRPTDELADSPPLLPEGVPYWVGLQTHWISTPTGGVRVSLRARLAAPGPSTLTALGTAVESCLRRRAGGGSGPQLFLRRIRPGRGDRRTWITGALPPWRGPSRIPLTSDLVPLAVSLPLETDPADEARLRHVAVFGTSGSGKTAALAHLAREALGEGRPVVVFDVHGDLVPRIVAGIRAEIASRVIGVDVTGNPPAIPGLAVFGPVPSADREALVAHLVAALKRLSTENGETFWGFRLERLFETFLHLVQEQGGTLVDLWSLLSDPRRRDAARLSTARPDAAQFLEELEGILRRQPEFLWPAASRVSKVVGSPLLQALLAPRDRPLDVRARLQEGSSVFWRLPIGELGPEGVTFAVTLLLTRIYLEEVRSVPPAGPGPGLRTLFVLDEAHLFPARLLAEMVAEGRKFGLGLVLATQYPARLAPELRAALAGAAGTVYLFRVPWASAADTGAWVGLSRDTAQRILPSLAPGWAVVGSTGPGADRRVVAMPRTTVADSSVWRAIVQRSVVQYGSPVAHPEGIPETDSERIEEDVLLGLVALEAERAPATRERLLRWLAYNESFDPVEGLRSLETLTHRGWVAIGRETVTLTAAGRERVGLAARTGARSESAEHRALLVAALRIFARQRERLEILRQGRFDTRLPDARVALLPPAYRRWSAEELRSYLDRRSATWVWRAFGGRDIHVEAEVSGATRRDRVERDWQKARDARAFLLVLVSDDRRARTVRRFLDRLSVPRAQAGVWTLRVAQAVHSGASPT